MATTEQNLERLANIKTSWRQALAAQGQTVSENDSMESYVTAVGNIEPNLQEKSLTVTQNGTQTVKADSGYDGIGSLELITNVSTPSGTFIETGTATGSNATQTATCPTFTKTITKIIDLSLQGITNFSYGFSFYNASNFGFLNLTEVSFTNTTNVANFSYLFYYACEKLEKVSGLNTSNATNLAYCFANCKKINTINSLDLVRATTLKGLLLGCSSLETFNFTETSAVTDLSSTFSGCTVLKYLNGVLDCNNVTDQSKMSPFGSSNKPTQLIEVRIKNLGLNLDLSFAPNLSYDSLIYLINNLKTISGKTLTLGATNVAKLTEEEVAIATAKGWTVS